MIEGVRIAYSYSFIPGLEYSLYDMYDIGREVRHGQENRVFLVSSGLLHTSIKGMLAFS